MVKVSVIVPIYNTEDYIEKALNSLMNQTLHDIQVILVNDGSTDNSGLIAKKYAELDNKKFIYIEQKNLGLSMARNNGMKYATGEYIAFLDSDDYIEVNAYEIMYNKAKEENSDIVECNFIWEYPDHKKIDIGGYPYYDRNDLAACFRSVAWNKLIKKDLIFDNKIEFPEGLIYEDFEFTCKLIPNLKTISYIKEALVHYVKRENALTKLQSNKILDIYEIINNVIKFYKDNNIYDFYRVGLEYRCIKTLLLDNMSRIARISEKKRRKEFFDINWKKMNNFFPDWKENEILKKQKNKKSYYMRSVNKFTYYSIYIYLFRMMEKIRKKEIWK